jgi:hypothetical protein
MSIDMSGESTPLGGVIECNFAGVCFIDHSMSVFSAFTKRMLCLAPICLTIAREEIAKYQMSWRLRESLVRHVA